MSYNRFKILNKTLLLSVVTSQLVLAGGDIAPVEEAVIAPTASGAYTFFNSVTANGEIRPRYEFVDTDNTTGDAKALTNRLMLGVSADLLNIDGLSTYLEAINVSGSGDYNDFSNGHTAYNKVADPSQTRITQAYIDYAFSDSLLRTGRQGMNLDNQRFVGTVNWRQMPQTYDAVSFTNKSVEGLSLLAAYVWHVNTILDADSANGNGYDTETVLLNAKYKVMDGLALTGYGYMIEDIHDTYGVAATGTLSLDTDTKLSYRAEYAKQTDPTSGNGTADADYYNLEATVNMSGFLAGAKYEVLGAGEDGNDAFSTPLATLHAHNGWADMFLGTPQDGLVDASGMLGYKTNSFGTAKVIYHDFSSDKGSTDYGTEIDALYTNKISAVKGLSGMLKAAYYSADTFKDDTTKYWAMLSYKF
ncbi:MAG: alginate export family protein [Sulfurovum sp.]|uniref:OprD family outer membrane porin n=1 Tax=Sulfurovum sp. TaxID=1969726 RepID=UPI002867CCC8|nr:OprD family outer membrane porin [Sulfurovum sp.]MCO4844607.1 alginate export family protein [Sulfurovum sp.]